MVIIVNKDDKVKTKNIYPNIDYRDYDGETDHRQEILPITAQYPKEGQQGPGPPPSPEQLHIARIAESVIAIVNKANLEPVADTVTDANRQAYWLVNTRNQTVESNIINNILSSIDETIDGIATLASQGFTADPRIVVALKKALQIQPDFVLDIKPELRGQPGFAYATGCLIDGDRILTCAHVDEFAGKNVADRFLENPSKFRALFGFRNGDVMNGQRLPAWQVRDFEKVEVLPWRVSDKIGAFDVGVRYDVAIVKLAPEIKGGEWPLYSKPGVPPPPTPIPMAIYRPFIPDDNMKVAMIGCPQGGPMKFTSGRIVDVPENEDILDPGSGGGDAWLKGPTTGPYFKNNLETFQGNSGSPVFAMKDNNFIIWGVHRSVSLPALLTPGSEPANIHKIVKDIVLGINSKAPVNNIAFGQLCEQLRYSQAGGIGISDDRKSGTFLKFADSATEGPNAKVQVKSCRIDPLRYLTIPIRRFAPTSSPNYETYVAVCFSAVFDNPNKAKAKAEPNPDFEFTFPDFSSASVVPTRSETNLEQVYYYAQYGGSNKDRSDFKANLYRYTGAPAVPGEYYGEFAGDVLASLGSVGAQGATSPEIGMLKLLQAGVVKIGTGTTKMSYVSGQVTLVYRLTSKAPKSLKSDGIPRSESFLFVGNLVKDDLAFHVDRWTGPISHENFSGL